MEPQILMTPQGEALLREELNRLKNVERPRITAAIAEARGHGDLSENAEYDAAREEQGMCEARIQLIESQLGAAHVIDVTRLPNPTKPERVVFGSTVTLEDLDSGKEIKYRIVGEEEADLAHGTISYRTPIARGLLGHSVGEEIEIHIPKGTVYYEIRKVEYI